MFTSRGERDAAITPPGPDDEMSRETVTLLLDEVARLEAELRARDEAAPVDDWPADGPAPADAELRSKVEQLTAELAGRDETIGVLLEQTQLFEEAAAAQRDEWEQLTRWVEEVEQRVGERGPDDGRQAEELAAERKRSEEQARRHEAEQTAWNAQKRRLLQELDALRAAQAGHPSKALEAEVRRLRAACAALEHDAAAVAELGPLRTRLAEGNDAVKQLRDQLRQERDDRAREKNEAEAAVTVLKSQLARVTLQRSSEILAQNGPPARPSTLDADERIRVLRQHLQEIHAREAEQRAQRGLAARLSRLWKNTGPIKK